jgi:dolichyl-phosphate-mannose-protein mannosyltransferase
VRAFLRREIRFFVPALFAGLLLRLFFFFYCARITDDSRFYADIAKNWLSHGIYGITNDGAIVPTLTRLPGYPAFLAFVFAIFGADHFKTVFILQILADLGTCLLVADIARRSCAGEASRDRVTKAAFLLAALCPFLANYASVALTETFEIFFTALALDSAIAGMDTLQSDNGASIRKFLVSGWATGVAILLRPDGGLLLASLGLYLLILLLRRGISNQTRISIARAGLVIAITALIPLAPWTIRNWHNLHRFQPLAPRYANEQDEQVPYGFNRWVRTWMAEYVSVEEIYWPIPGEEVDASRLPERAFDSAEQRQATLDILSAYNEDHSISPELDDRFAMLAAERVRAHPLRYYVELPIIRVADMWLRPRTELLPPDVRWWEFNDDPQWSVLAVGFGVINLFYVLAALIGIFRFRTIRYAGLLLGFLLLRSAFLGTLENPEPRYTLECYPIVIVLVANGLLARP